MTQETMKIAYLSAYSVLPENPNRRSDAYEHDLQFACLSEPLVAAGHELVVVQWDRADVDWAQFDAALIGATWDYTDKREAFLARLEEIEALGVPVFNPSFLVRWNSRKTYLRELEDKGIACIPTIWADCPTAHELEAAFDTLNSQRIVVKRQVGAGAGGQILINRDDPLSDYAYPAMIQPFMSSIQQEGEFSFIMIDGELSHALIKRAKTGDYRIQSAYGGYEEPIVPSADDLAAANSVLAVLDEMPLYARVDMIRGNDGHLLLMELELIEPYLYPEQSDELGVILCRALCKRVR
uniref:ATP-grasp domain-containing protein n=1 Tax=Ponticaulis koreensis TaxID=1123045 RepID=UPI0003B62200|nr:hypothetical protein [Ponticaulis koreensis]